MREEKATTWQRQAGCEPECEGGAVKRNPKDEVRQKKKYNRARCDVYTQGPELGLEKVTFTYRGATS